MYEIVNIFNGKTLGWSATTLGAYRKVKMFERYGINATFIPPGL